MHEQPKRQLFSAYRAALVALAGIGFAIAKAKAADPGAQQNALDEQLKAARITENAVFGGAGTPGKEQPAPEDLEKIAHLYKQIVERNPKNAGALNAEGEFLWRIERHPDAMSEWRTAEKLDAGNAAVAGNLATGYLELGRAKLATEYYEQAARLDPKNALFQFNAGNTAYMFRHEITSSTDDEKAVILRAFSHFQTAARIDPFNIDYALAYAQAFYFVLPPDWNTALQAWIHYMELTNEKDYAYSNLARVNLKLGNKKEARDNLEKIENEKFAAMKKHLLLEVDAP